LNAIETALLVCLISLSSFFSSSEVAIFSLSRFQIRQLKESFIAAQKKIKTLLADPGGLLITILIANEVINVSMATVIASVISRKWESINNTLVNTYNINIMRDLPDWASQSVFVIIFTTPVLLILCEVTPKVIGTRMNHIIAPIFVKPLFFIYNIFRPIRIILTAITRLFFKSKNTTGEKNKKNSILSEKDFLYLVERGKEEGLVHESEVDLIKNIFDLDDTTVTEVCTPINKTFLIPKEMKIKDANKIIDIKKLSRIPVIGKNRNDIVGVLHSKDLLYLKLNEKELEGAVSQHMRTPYFVSESTKLNALFRRLKKNNTHMAIVESQKKLPIGIITMNDMIDEVFEDLFSKKNKGNSSS